MFAGTGEKGVIYKITPDGKGTTFYETKATHATALAFDKAGNLLVGTGSPGRVLRVDAEGKAFVLLDSPFDEMRALRFDDKGTLYVVRAQRPASSGGAAPAAVEDRPPSTVDAGRAPVPSVSSRRDHVVRGRRPGQSAAAHPPRRHAKTGAPPKGPSTASPPTDSGISSGSPATTRPTTSRSTANGALIVGTGNKGKIYRLDGDPVQPTLLARASAQQITGVLQRRARPPVLRDRESRESCSGCRPNGATRGTYESEPRDAQMVSTWGTLSWHGVASGGNQIELFTRSGNTETPDETWSAVVGGLHSA